MKRENNSFKDRKIPWSVVICFTIVILTIIFALIPDRIITGGVSSTSKEFSGESEQKSGNEVIEGDIEIESSTSDGIRYSTVYGGADYTGAVEKYWSENSLNNHDKIYSYLEGLNLKQEFTGLSHAELVVSRADTHQYVEGDKLDESYFSSYERVIFYQCAEVIGVFDDYYIVCRVSGSDDCILVLDGSLRSFDKDEELVCIGSVLSAVLDKEYTSIKTDSGFTYCFIGAVDTSLAKDIGTSYTIEGIRGMFDVSKLPEESSCIRNSEVSYRAGHEGVVDFYYNRYSDCSFIDMKNGVDNIRMLCCLSNLTYLGKAQDCDVFELSEAEVLLVQGLGGTYILGEIYSLAIPFCNIVVSTDTDYTTLYARVIEE